MSTVIDTPDGIKFFQMGARKGALELEMHGLKRRGQSAYSICKQVYGLKGDRLSVLTQMEFMVEGALARKHGATGEQVNETLKGHTSTNRRAFRIGYTGDWVNWP